LEYQRPSLMLTILGLTEDGEMKRLIGVLVVVFLVAAVGVAVAGFNFTNGCLGWDGTKAVLRTSSGGFIESRGTNRTAFWSIPTV